MFRITLSGFGLGYLYRQMYKIWCNADLGPKALEALRLGTARHELVFSEQKTANLGAGIADPWLEGADIAFGQPDAAQAMAVPSLKWIQITSAGYTRYDRDDFRTALRARGATFTNSSTVFAEPCAQHVLAFMLAFARQLPQAMQAQLGENKWNYAPLRTGSRILGDETVLILGYGAIAQRLAQLLRPFSLLVDGVRRRVTGEETIPVVTTDEVDRLIPDADHIVNILPASPETEGFVSAARFAAMKPGAKFYNIGRGTTVDQPALIAALESGHLGLAYLDVMDPEPLPSDHPLWTAPNCFITPHTAGGHFDEDVTLVRHFLENLARYETQFALKDRIV